MMKLILIVSTLLLVGCGGDSGGGAGSVGSVGQGGSLATFSIVNNQLFIMDTQHVVGFNLNDGVNIEPFDTFIIDEADGETLFNHQGSHLLIGRQSGVDVLELNAEGEMRKIASHEHVTSCDPVITQGNRAFLTINSSGSRCQTGDNRLEVLDISDPGAPKLIFSEAMASPQGLAVKGSDLFVCDSDRGLKRFTIVDEGNDNFDLEAAYVGDSFFCDDIIINNDVLILKKRTGITQVRWDGGDDFTRLSDIAREGY